MGRYVGQVFGPARRADGKNTSRASRVALMMRRDRAYAQQHETAADIDDGGRVFRDTCANCHGPDGDEVAGHRSRPRRSSAARMTDQDLVQHHPERHSRTRAMPATQLRRRAGGAGRGLPALGRGRRKRSASVRRRRRARQGACSTARARARRAIASTAPARASGPDLSSIGQLRRAVGARDSRSSIRTPRSRRTNRTYRVVTEGRHDDHRPAAQPRHLHRAAARHRRSSCARSTKPTCATTASSPSPMPSYQRQAERAGDWPTSSATSCR